MTRLRIIIPGGSGHVGHLLAQHFHQAGHEVVVLSRHQKSMPWRTVLWDGKNLGEWTEHIDGADLVINLAGRSVDCRYTTTNRREITESRIGTTSLIGRAIAQSPHPPAIWMNASTATIYRHALDRAMDEATGQLGGNELRQRGDSASTLQLPGSEPSSNLLRRTHARSPYAAP